MTTAALRTALTHELARRGLSLNHALSRADRADLARIYAVNVLTISARVSELRKSQGISLVIGRRTNTQRMSKWVGAKGFGLLTALGLAMANDYGWPWVAGRTESGRAFLACQTPDGRIGIAEEVWSEADLSTAALVPGEMREVSVSDPVVGAVAWRAMR